MEKGRKIVISYLGIANSVLNAVGLLVCFAAGIYYIHLHNSKSYFSSIHEERFMMLLGFSPMALSELQNECDQFYVLASLSCYLAGCLPLFYIHVKALIEPSFAVGNPDRLVKNRIYMLSTNCVFIEIFSFIFSTLSQIHL